jgi:hypothetical protein
MSEQHAAFGMKAMIDILMNRNMPAATNAEMPQSDDSATMLPFAAESWARRTMWILVIVTSAWDVAVTFDRHFALTARLF